MKSLFWFRGDLRLDDNPGLKACFENSNEVNAIYIFSKKQLNLHNESNVKIDFLIKNLISLESDLKNLNIPLTIVNSEGFEDNPSLISELASQRKLKKVFWNNQFGQDETERDIKTSDLLKKLGIDSESFHDQVVYAPGTLRTGQDSPYSVFTPFKRKWIDNFDMNSLDIDYKYEKKKPTNIESNIDNLDFEKTHQADMGLWKEGEEEAIKRVKNFLKEKAIHYSKDRNDPIIDGTSRISPYLALGIISPKRCILEALKVNNFEFTSGHIGITKWIDEIQSYLPLGLLKYIFWMK